MGVAVSLEYVRELKPETCVSEVRKTIHYDEQMKQYITQNSVKPMSTAHESYKNIVNKPEFIINLKKFMKRNKKKQKEQIQGAYKMFKTVRGSIFTKEEIGHNPSVCKALNLNKRKRVKSSYLMQAIKQPNSEDLRVVQINNPKPTYSLKT